VFNLNNFRLIYNIELVHLLVCDIQCLFSFILHVEFFRAEVTRKFEYTKISVAIAEVPLDIVMRRLKKLLKLFRIRPLDEYLNLYNKNKKCTCAKYIDNK